MIDWGLVACWAVVAVMTVLVFRQRRESSKWGSVADRWKKATETQLNNLIEAEKENRGLTAKVAKLEIALATERSRRRQQAAVHRAATRCPASQDKGPFDLHGVERCEP